MAKKVIEPVPQNLKKEYIYSDEISTDTWIFNSKGQLLEVKFDWDKKYLKKYKDDVEFQLSLPKSKRQYINPENGKFVGYARAKALGFFEDDN
jgi:hypothetical protein